MRIVVLLCLLPGTALAQVTTNDQALQALKPAAPAAPQAAPAKTPARTHTARPRQAGATHRHAPAAHASRGIALPTVPNAPPANPVIMPPPMVLPVHAPAPPPPIKLVPEAPTKTVALDGGLRLLFGPGSAELNKPTYDALESVAAAAKLDPLKEITVTAWAPGAAEDPSTPHRLSLDRALAARAVLIHAGIVSERIHAVAKGFNDIGGGPPDRADVVAARPRSTPPGAAHS